MKPWLALAGLWICSGLRAAPVEVPLERIGFGSCYKPEKQTSLWAEVKRTNPQLWIWLGDNAYNNGKDEEYQKNVFDVYQSAFLQNLPIYPSPGNHDYGGKHDPKEPPYFKIFNMPIEGQAGGVPSHA